MNNENVLYPFHGRLETEILARKKIKREEIKDAIGYYILEENAYFSMILGVNGDGVICSPIKNWTPTHPLAFSSLTTVPWKIVQKYHRKIQQEKERR